MTEPKKRAELIKELESLISEAHIAVADLKHGDDLPPEPSGVSAGAVVYFTKRFKSSDQLYHYAAIRDSDTRWRITDSSMFTTGVTWTRLVRWIVAGVEWEIWSCSTWNRIANSRGGR